MKWMLQLLGGLLVVSLPQRARAYSSAAGSCDHAGVIHGRAGARPPRVRVHVFNDLGI